MAMYYLSNEWDRTEPCHNAWVESLYRSGTLINETLIADFESWLIDPSDDAIYNKKIEP